MKLLLKRRYLGPDYTIGSLLVNGVKLCDVIEDKVRDHNMDGDLDDPGEQKVFGETAIPYGVYDVDLTMSPKFKRVLPLIQNVPHFTGIRIHRGNTAKDSHGCPLVGENKVKGKVINSTKWELKLVEIILAAIKRGERIQIHVTR